MIRYNNFERKYKKLFYTTFVRDINPLRNYSSHNLNYNNEITYRINMLKYLNGQNNFILIPNHIILQNNYIK